MLTRAQMENGLDRLDAIRAEVKAHIEDQWYAPFSGQPEQSLGALRMAYADTVDHLRPDIPNVLAGKHTPEKWLAMVDLAEESMRAISGYADGASARSEVNYVAEKTVETVAEGAGNIAGGLAKASGSILWATVKGLAKGAPVLVFGLVAVAIALAYFTLRPIRKVAQ